MPILRSIDVQIISVFVSLLIASVLYIVLPPNITAEVLFVVPLALVTLVLDVRMTKIVAAVSIVLLFGILAILSLSRPVQLHEYVNISIVFLMIVTLFMMSHQINKKVFSVEGLSELIDHSKILDKILESSSEGLVLCTKEGKLSYFNRKAEKILGIGLTNSEKEEWSKTYGLFRVDKITPFPSEDFPLNRALKGEHVIGVEVFVKNSETPDGANIIIDAFPLYTGKDSKVSGAMAHFLDVSETSTLRSQLLHSQKLEAVGKLAGGIAHDFNNKLGAMKLVSENLSNRLIAAESLTEPVLKDLDLLAQCIDTCSKLTKQILAFSRKQILSPETVVIDELIEGKAEVYRRLLGERVKLNLRLNSQNNSIKIDRGQFEQVLLNLIVNAKESIPETGYVSVETAVHDNIGTKLPTGYYFIVSVSDTGSGIESKNINKIFDAYFTTKKSGSGLGLSMVHGIVKQSGGEILVYSELGKGTSIKVYFPLHSKEYVKYDLAKIPKIDISGVRVLIVEDEESLIGPLCESIRNMGAEVQAAACGEEVLNSTRGSQFDVLLTDTVLPGINGKQLAEELVKDNPELITIFMSGYPEDIISKFGILEKNIIYLPKPFSANSFLEKLEDAMGKRDLK